jgi:hypothetical protein
MDENKKHAAAQRKETEGIQNIRETRGAGLIFLEFC